MELDMPTGDRRRYLLIGVAAGVAVAALGFLLMQTVPDLSDTARQRQQDQASESFEQYADASEKTGTRNVGDAKIAATITITEFGTTPARATIKTGQAVKWVNKNPFPVYIRFDRTPQEPTIGPGEELTMRFRGVTYYKVFNANTDERVARGSISVG